MTMKINLKYLTIIAFAGLLLTGCDDGDKVIDEIFETTTRGAILRTVGTSGGDYDRFDTSSIYGFTVEAQDVENGKLLEKMEIFVNFIDNTPDNGNVSPAEVLVATVPASEFEEGPFGLPRASYESTLGQALTNLGLVEGDFDGGDVIFFRLASTLTDGRVFTNSGNTSTLSGSFLASPFQYDRTIKCIPPSPVPGRYVMELADSYGDGWDGAKITVNIDGTVTEYTLEAGSATSHNVDVPEGTTELVFTYVAGRFEEEHSYEITAPTDELAIKDGPTPSQGELVLNICKG